jgi:hypothetical protein
MRAPVSILVLTFLATQAQAYWGSFDPILLKNNATITVIDTQFPNLECAARATNLIEAPLIAALAAGCTDLSNDTLIAPISPGPAWAYLLTNLVTPNQLLGHELSHIFRGEFHPPFLSFVERVRPKDVPRGVVSGEQHARDVQQSLAPNSRDNENRVFGAGGTVCVFWTDNKEVSYDDFGSLVRACFK